MKKLILHMTLGRPLSVSVHTIPHVCDEIRILNDLKVPADSCIVSISDPWCTHSAIMTPFQMLLYSHCKEDTTIHLFSLIIGYSDFYQFFTQYRSRNEHL